MVSMKPLERRHAAIEATMARYRNRPFAWGKVDCARVVAFHLKQLGFKIAISKGGTYKSAVGAKSAIRRMGYETLGDMADGLGLTPIAPARMLLGDVCEVEGDNPVGTLCLYAGNGNIFGFHQDHPALVALKPNAVLRAWSVL